MGQLTTSVALAKEKALTPVGKGEIIFILDRSGSMGGKESDVIGGFNSAIKTLRENSNGSPCSVAYWRFDEQIEKVYEVELTDVPEMTERYYQPRGSTALLDAVGGAVGDSVNDPDVSYVVITFTDGYENASQEWTKDKVSQLIKQRQDLGNWTFAFFGADIDAWADAGAMGFSAGNTRGHTSAQTADMMKATGRVSAMYSKGKVRSSKHFTDATSAAFDNPDISDDELNRVLEDGENSD